MVSLVGRGMRAGVLEPALSVLSLATAAAAGSAAAAEAGEWLSDAGAATLAFYGRALASLVAPGMGLLSVLDDTCRARAAPHACGVHARGGVLAAPARTARQLSSNPNPNPHPSPSPSPSPSPKP